MTKLQLLNAYLTERLGEVVREILDVVEDTVSEYLEETARTRRENDSLRRQLRDAVLLAKTDLFVSAPAADVPSVRHVEWTPMTPQDPRLSPAPVGGPRGRGASEVMAKEEPMEEPLRPPTLATFDPQVKTEPEEADITVTITTDMLPMATDSASLPTPAQNTHSHTLTPSHTHTHAHTHTLDPLHTHTHTRTHTQDPLHTHTEPSLAQASVAGAVGGVCVRAERVCVSPLQCGVCGEVCVGREALEQHQLSGAHRRPFGCECCGRRFTQSADLRRHMRTHTGERPHQCHLCHKRFSQIGNLRRHQRTHTRTHP